MYSLLSEERVQRHLAALALLESSPVAVEVPPWKDRLDYAFHIFALTRHISAQIASGRIPKEIKVTAREAADWHNAVPAAQELMRSLEKARVFMIPLEVFGVCWGRSRTWLTGVLKDKASILNSDNPDVEKDRLWEFLAEFNQVPLPTKHPFEVMFILTAPPLTLWGQDLENVFPNAPKDLKIAYGGWVVDFPKGLVVEVLVVGDEEGTPYTVRCGTLYRNGAWCCSPATMTSWTFRQVMEVINAQKTVSVDPIGRMTRNALTQKAFRGNRKSSRPRTPPDFYEVKVRTVIVEPDEEPLSTCSGRSLMQDYHTDRRGHERVLVRQISAAAPAQDITKFITKWSEKGYTVFHRPDMEIDALLGMEARAAGLHLPGVIRALKVVWVKEHLIGNKTARYVPATRTLSPKALSL